jgi:uncharacterized protein with LGFP repeats
VAFAGVIGLGAPAPAEALSGSQFDPGNIISDDVFFNYGSMTADQIQAFLVAMEPSCPAANGYPCLKDFRADTYSRPDAGANRCTAYNGAAGELASQIIWRVSQACKINPQVLLATLQKEQGLVTTTSPTYYQYRSAMGYGCPDTAACDSAFYGFYNQVYKAAWQFRTYTRSPLEWNFHPGNIAIQWHPNAKCGSSVVNIKNQATANLYNYTPYQPNTAALNNLGGGGDACSSFGNRNFWVYFNTWFGSSVSQGPLLIAQLYSAYGGAAGALGSATSPILQISENDGGLGQAYQNASIYWSINSGAHVVVAGSLRDYYFSLGGAAGKLAWPVTDTAVVSSNGGGIAQAFTRGSVFSSPSGTFLLSDPIRQGYFSRGGANGDLGWPTSESSCSLPDGGCKQSFQAGVVYGTPSGGAFPVMGAIATTFDSLGGAGGALGYPSSGPIAIGQNGGGVGQAFTGGSIYAKGTGLAIAVSGGIRDYYFANSGAGGTLGWPARAATCDSAATQCSQVFQGGTVLWSESGGARIGSPEIEAVYTSLGGASGSLGAPTSGLINIPQNGGGLGQVYAKGSIYWASGTGAYAVTGGIRDRYFANGGAAGALGWPTAAAVCTFSNNGCAQAFQSNSIIGGRASTGYYTVAGAYVQALIAAGGTTGVLGLPQSGILPISANGSGTGQVFDGGSIFSSGSGTYAVSGGIRDFYFAHGGAAGSLGWPTGNGSCVANGPCSQQFQGGLVTWTAAGGSKLGQ